MSTPCKECCSAGSLETLLDHLLDTGGLGGRNQISRQALSLICSQLGGALMYVHQFKLVHRDVKSENVLLGQGCAAMFVHRACGLTMVQTIKCNSCISK